MSFTLSVSVAYVVYAVVVSQVNLRKPHIYVYRKVSFRSTDPWPAVGEIC